MSEKQSILCLEVQEVLEDREFDMVRKTLDEWERNGIVPVVLVGVRAEPEGNRFVWRTALSGEGLAEAFHFLMHESKKKTEKVN